MTTDEFWLSVSLLLDQYRDSRKDGKITLTEWFGLLQRFVFIAVQHAETIENLDGETKKKLVLMAVDRFYVETLAPLDIPGLPNYIEPLVDQLLRPIFNATVSSLVDVAVWLFNRIGWPKQSLLEEPKEEEKKSE